MIILLFGNIESLIEHVASTHGKESRIFRQFVLGIEQVLSPILLRLFPYISTISSQS